VSEKHIVDAVDELGMLRMFPSTNGARLGIMKLLGRMVERKDQLDWLVSTMVNRVGEWRGPAEMRGVYCSRFKPFDGIEADCINTPGFTPDEQEAKALAKHEEIKSLPPGKENDITREIVRIATMKGMK
jgi:hypothetical protein